jgi:HAD superfamily hydrolase (TIGR01509 family)
VQRLGVEADALIGAEDIKRGKPNPDLYLCAAARMGVPPRFCIVVEDSEAGIEAAKAAGMNAMRFHEHVPE